MKADSVVVRPCAGMDELEQCVQLQLSTWGYADGDLVPRKMFLLAQKIGGQVFGAFDGSRMAGFAMALPGYRNGMPYLHSHMLAVLPEYRNHGLGRRMKLAQRDDALARGIKLIEWTFDPLEIKNAYLNITKLGVISRRYQADVYGPSTSPLQGGLPTDRLYAEWWLRSGRVTRILDGKAGLEEALERVVVPHAVQEWKSNIDQRKLAKALQQRNKEAFESAFGQGLAVIGYERGSNGDGCFLLGRYEPGTGVDSAEE